MPSKHDKKGRTKGSGRFVMLPHFMLESAAWQALTVYERASYIEVAKLYDGANNGFLAMGARRLGELLGGSKNTGSKALRGLVDKGFIELAEKSGFSRKDRVAAAYRLTLCRCDRTQQPGSRAFQKWRPSDVQEKSTVPPDDLTVPRGGTVDG